MIHFWESIRQSWKFRKGYWVKTDAFPFSSSLQLKSVLEEDMGCSGLKADVWILLYLPCCLCSKRYSNLLPFKESIQDPKLLPVFAFTTALKLDRLFQKNKSVIFKQGWRRLHMCLLHFQSSTLTSLIGGWMKMPPASPNTNLIQSTHFTLWAWWQSGPQQDFPSLLLSVHFSLKQGRADRALSIPDLLPAGWPAATLTHCWNL